MTRAVWPKNVVSLSPSSLPPGPMADASLLCWRRQAGWQHPSRVLETEIWCESRGPVFLIYKVILLISSRWCFCED